MKLFHTIFLFLLSIDQRDLFSGSVKETKIIYEDKENRQLNIA